MKFFVKKKNSKLTEEERMHYSASSFSFAVGDVFTVSDYEDARLLLESRMGYVVILVPGDDLIENPRAWVRALSSASYVIIYADEKDNRLKPFLTALDGQIFSPLARTISGSIWLKDGAEIKQLASTLLAEGKRCLTIIPGNK